MTTKKELSKDSIMVILKKYKPNAKESTLKTYVGKIFKVWDVLNINIDEQDDIIKKLKDADIKINTKKGYLASLAVYNQAINHKYDKILELLLFYKKEQDKEPKNKKSEKEEANWIDLKELVELLNKNLKKLKFENIHKKGKVVLNKYEKNLLQEVLVMGLYLLQDVRRNVYFNTKYIKYSSYKKLSIEDQEKNNYLVWGRGENKFFSFGDWKNSKSSGRQIVQIKNKKLIMIIKLWAKFNKNKNNKFLLYNQRGNQMTTNNLTKYLKKIFKPTGKIITSTLLRKLSISQDKDIIQYRKNKKAIEEKAQKMGHSVNVQQNDYFKN